MANRMPVIFVAHGAPDAFLKAPDTLAVWREIGAMLPHPKGILVISAHWEAPRPCVSLAGSPQTIHDFSGFSPELYDMKYSAPGAPLLAQRVASLLNAAGIATDRHPDRGLDHGAWVPLSVMFPHADIPVTQLSLTLDKNAAYHFAIGKLLAALRDEDILILASGAITHNFTWLNWRANDDQIPYPQAYAFNAWVAEKLAVNDVAAMLDYRLAPHGAEAHPTEEHFMPLLLAMGAANGDTPVRFQPRFNYGALSMDAYLWR
ncbi:MAG: class III extradiol ring-cleavage dioxygenase [Gallionellaceae bacterium]|jgi:4,5-DOPA dioxygenase extradiol